MKRFTNTAVVPGIVGGALGGLLWALLNPTDITDSSLQFVREGALILVIAMVAGFMIGIIGNGSTRLVWHVIGSREDESEGTVRTGFALLLSGGAWATYVLVGPGITQQLAMIIGVAFLAIAGFAFLRTRHPEESAPAQVARWLGIFAGGGFFVLWLRAVRTGAAPFGLWGLIITVPAGAGIGYGFCHLGGWFLRRISSRTSPRAAAGIVSLLLILPLLGLAGWSIAAAGGVDFDQQLTQIPAASADSSRPNIILISVDTLRADAVGYAGGDARTPTLDALAEESYVFEQAYSVAPWTRPSFAAFFSSRYPSEMGVARIQGADLQAFPWVWREDRQLLAEVFKKEGYATGAVVTNNNLTRQARADQGFDFFYHCSLDAENTPAIVKDFAKALYEPDPAFTSVFEMERAEMVSPRVLRLIDHNPDQPTLLWMHYMDPHHPYDPPTIAKSERVIAACSKTRAGAANGAAPERARFWRAYNAEIDYFDTWVRRVIDQLKADGMWDNSVVVFWSDHGEEFWDHGGWYHGRSLYTELVHVPLLIHLPGQTNTRRIKQRVSLLDIMPTLIDYCDAKGPSGMRGQSLMTLIQDVDTSSYTCNYFLEGCNLGSVQKALLTDRWKLIYDVYQDDFSLYDMENDAAEKHDIYGTALAPDTSEMEKRLLGWVEESQALMQEYISSSEEADLSPQIRQNLKDMGYIQ